MTSSRLLLKIYNQRQKNYAETIHTGTIILSPIVAVPQAWWLLWTQVVGDYYDTYACPGGAEAQTCSWTRWLLIFTQTRVRKPTLRPYKFVHRYVTQQAFSTTQQRFVCPYVTLQVPAASSSAVCESPLYLPTQPERYVQIEEDIIYGINEFT